jgi:uncharacterized protein YjbI with pentapeptide repeats
MQSGAAAGARRAATGWLLLASLALAAIPARAASTADLMRLLEKRSCRDCHLQNADLVHADLRDADLRGALLQRANLSESQLDGAQLGGADLSFTSLQGASLRGADLRGARLEGTDLRRSDLSGALLDPGSLARSHWQHTQGLDPQQLSYAELHNTGVEAAMAGRQPEAERWFGEAIRRQPEAAVSWVARGLSRAEQGKTELAGQDLTYAARLYEQGGDQEQAKQLRQIGSTMLAPAKKEKGGNGLGGQLLSGAAGLAQVLAPLALKFLVPMAF